MRILILRLSSIGDIVLTQPVVAALAKEYPKAELHYLTKKAFITIVEAFGVPIKIFAWEDLKSFGALNKFGKKYKFDLVIDLHGKLNTFLIKAVVAGKKSVTYNKYHLLRRSIVSHKTSGTIASTVELYFTALTKIGLGQEFTYPKLIPNQELLITKLSDLKKNSSLKLVGIFPGALHYTKQYPIDLLKESLELIATKSNCRFIVMGSSKEQHLAKHLIKHSELEIVNLCGKLSLEELIVSVSCLDAVISNDSGPMHIAAALDIPQLAIFGATHPKLGFAPLNNKAIVLTANIPCQPCSLHGSNSCPNKHFNCMRFITPEIVSRKFTEII